MVLLLYVNWPGAMGPKGCMQHIFEQLLKCMQGRLDVQSFPGRGGRVLNWPGAMEPDERCTKEEPAGYEGT